MNKTNLLVLLGAMIFSALTVNAKTRDLNGYGLEMELSLNGKVISAPQINTKVGETSFITQKTDSEESFIEVTAIDGSILGNDGIMMTFVVGTIDKDGNRVITSKPQIFAKENTHSEVTVEQDGGKETLSLSVLAKRKSL